MHRAAAAVLTAIALSACSEGLNDVDNQRMAGTYTLRTLAGDSLPITIDSSATRRVQFAASELLIGLNGNYREIDTFRLTQGGTTTTQIDTFTGIWTAGSTFGTLTFTAADGGGTVSISGVWNGREQITLNSDGILWVYRKP